jgi:hypothetical protein
VWHQVIAKKGKTKKANRLLQWTMIVEEGRPPPAYKKGTDNNDEWLQALSE